MIIANTKVRMTGIISPSLRDHVANASPPSGAIPNIIAQSPRFNEGDSPIMEKTGARGDD